ncbi:pyridoxamine 5'-phosphate oxidase family protein [Roseibium sp. CAU 1637]|uniref:Pyridoxamine 5'-phosphate oxidase family protein n=1 Tax=Roseibium limicola TaxID=2816037 RepID=A0A939J7V6_9HYPH|nr:pyridoxamine 5'-phosphate oxidase family protein [Roseibium limicola]MBO0344646.1 pyridoxamine 5'-phosphate oxidase family protein [Roseibium limicola]
MPDIISNLAELEAHYGTPGAASLVKVSKELTEEYRQLIAASPFCALATSGPDGLDCSPRGDAGTCLEIESNTTLLMPDRRGNNRIDSLRNIIHDPRIALMLLIPGSGTCVRINGKAEISVEPKLLNKLSQEGKQPRSVIRIHIDEIYFQCARAVMRAALWDENARTDPETLPTPGEILASLSAGEVGGETYDKEWPERAASSMW